MNKIRIGNTWIGAGEPCYIISEIGAMYEDIEGMKKLIALSGEAGAHAVKMQTYRAETIALPGSTFEFEDGSKMSQYDFFKRYEISEANHRILFQYAKEIGIDLFSTPSHFEDVDFLDSLGVPVFKTGSDDLTNLPFLKYMAQKGKPMIVSTGMCTMGEIEEAVETIRSTGNTQLALLHCTVSYPVDPASANLNIIKTLEQAFDLPIGYSDHVPGTLPSVLASAMGACIVEKHVTLDRSLKRADYQVSLEPHELKTMVDQIRLIPILQGSRVKKVFPTEEKWRRNARKSLVAARNLNAGDVIRDQDIKIMRPGTGIHPRNLPLIVGRTVTRAIRENELITLANV
ncbi:MAG: N-acetylneuraminate synthase family protein [Candidatus Omnitrophota bacterium]